MEKKSLHNCALVLDDTLLGFTVGLFMPQPPENCTILCFFGGEAYSLVACLRHLTIDHASLLETEHPFGGEGGGGITWI